MSTTSPWLWSGTTSPTPLDGGVAPITPTKGLRPLDSACGALPRTPAGALPLHPNRGRCPRYPRKGLRPLTHHPKPKGLGDFYEKVFPLFVVRTTIIGGDSEGVQGAIGKPPGCPCKDKKQVSDKTLHNSSGVRRSVAAHGLHRSSPEAGRPREAFVGQSTQ